jgi:hypothetical protein
MRKMLAGLLVTVAVGGGLAAIPTVAVAKSCHAGYVHAVIGGKQKCLRRGEFCAHRYSNQYHRYGFNCVRKHGEYFLEPRG